MNKNLKNLRILSRRDTLKACVVPVTAALTARFLPACSAADSGEPELASTGSSSVTPQTPAAGSSATSATAGTRSITPAANGGSGAPASSARAGTGGPQTSSAGSTAPSSSTGGTGGAQASAGSGGGTASTATAGAPSAGAPSTGSGGALAQAGAGGSAASTNGVAGPGVMWATGGTAMMAASYPDPFEAGPGAMCRLYPAQTLGPCYAEEPMMRQDISDKLDGLPTRVSFLVVEADGCTPIPNATVDIWHSGSQGIYSAYATGTTCNPGSDDVMSDMFCRGVQAVDETGRCNFSTVFPGWYRGRTLHIHFTVRVGGRETVTSQLYFDDKLVDEILAQGYYKARGMRDTTNQADRIFLSGGATEDQVVMEHAKRPDGVLHLWKVLAIG
jgi:protocatechuate 3,4-dioxygenase beta subunit